VKFGVVEAQIAMALAGVDRQEMLTTLLESVIRIEQGSGPDRPGVSTAP
jgi:UTP--glucose-1-phosphate uridylyltransferase